MKKITAFICIAFLLLAQSVGAETNTTVNKQSAPNMNTRAETMIKKPPAPAAVKKEAPKRSSENKGSLPAYMSDYTARLSPSETRLDELKNTLENTNITNILPDVSTAIELSASDVNRVTCVNGAITDVIYSQEKGLVVKYSGKNAFIKFHVISEGNKSKLLYSNTPTEIYFVCDDQVYTVVALPKRIPAQQVKLSNAVVNRIKQNKDFFADMSYEQRLVTIIQRTYKDDFEDSWIVHGINRIIDDFSNYQVTHVRNVVIEGEGILLKEYHVRFTDMTRMEGGRIEEKMFLTRDLTSNTVAIALDKTLVKPNERVRLFIVESKGEK
jgi:conjugal transfer pilus assembly protein TraK